MGSDQKVKITVHTTVNAPIEKVWEKWITPDDIINWNNASDEWHTTKAEIDLKAGGKFLSRMEAKDGSAGFDFWGTFDNIMMHELIEYTMGDGRKVTVIFTQDNGNTVVTETFEAESENSVELQKNGWQSIMDNFRKYTESQ